jgi:hypothetical protein
MSVNAEVYLIVGLDIEPFLTDKFEDWKILPDELSKRMTYMPDKNDKTRNLILKQIEELKRGLNRET